MKARVQKKAVPKVLLYNLENRKSAEIAQMCRELGAVPVELDTFSACSSVGSLCGIRGYDSGIIPCGSGIPQSEAMVLYEVSTDMRNELFERMRRTHNTVALKCIVTETNKSWALGDLVAELEKEHTALNGKA